MENRDLAIEQIKLQEKIQQLANINIVTCGNCGDVLLHEIDKTEIQCVGCLEVMDVSDCPDLWYRGFENNEVFNNTTKN